MMLAEMSSQPPPRRSVRASLLQQYYLRRDEISYQRDLAQAQLIIDQKHGIEKFAQFQKMMFPWMETAQRREKESHAEVLRKEINRGPLLVTAQGEPDVRRRTVNRAVRHAEPVKNSDHIYRRLGKTQLK